MYILVMQILNFEFFSYLHSLNYSMVQVQNQGQLPILDIVQHEIVGFDLRTLIASLVFLTTENYVSFHILLVNICTADRAEAWVAL